MYGIGISYENYTRIREDKVEHSSTIVPISNVNTVPYQEFDKDT